MTSRSILLEKKKKKYGTNIWIYYHDDDEEGENVVEDEGVEEAWKWVTAMTGQGVLAVEEEDEEEEEDEVEEIIAEEEIEVEDAEEETKSDEVDATKAGEQRGEEEDEEECCKWGVGTYESPEFDPKKEKNGVVNRDEPAECHTFFEEWGDSHLPDLELSALPDFLNL